MPSDSVTAIVPEVHVHTELTHSLPGVHTAVIVSHVPPTATEVDWHTCLLSYKSFA